MDIRPIATQSTPTYPRRRASHLGGWLRRSAAAAGLVAAVGLGSLACDGMRLAGEAMPISLFSCAETTPDDPPVIAPSSYIEGELCGTNQTAFAAFDVGEPTTYNFSVEGANVIVSLINESGAEIASFTQEDVDEYTSDYFTLSIVAVAQP